LGSEKKETDENLVKATVARKDLSNKEKKD